MSFVHLHTHSEYSLLDGANRISDLVRRTAELEMPAVALTDHGCLFGAWTFQDETRKAGLKPIIGMEAYVAPGDRRVRGSRTAEARKVDGQNGNGGERERAYYHLVLLARDLEGYRNLVKLSSIGYLEGFFCLLTIFVTPSGVFQSILPMLIGYVMTTGAAPALARGK